MWMGTFLAKPFWSLIRILKSFTVCTFKKSLLIINIMNITIQKWIWAFKNLKFFMQIFLFKKLLYISDSTWYVLWYSQGISGYSPYSLKWWLIVEKHGTFLPLISNFRHVRITTKSSIIFCPQLHRGLKMEKIL